MHRNKKGFSLELTPELNTTLEELADLAGITKSAVARHLFQLGAPSFRDLIRRGILPPDPLMVWREEIVRRQ